MSGLIVIEGVSVVGSVVVVVMMMRDELRRRVTLDFGVVTSWIVRRFVMLKNEVHTESVTSSIKVLTRITNSYLFVISVTPPKENGSK
jgi:hypothetical protein